MEQPCRTNAPHKKLSPCQGFLLLCAIALQAAREPYLIHLCFQQDTAVRFWHILCVLPIRVGNRTDPSLMTHISLSPLVRDFAVNHRTSALSPFRVRIL